MTAYMKNLALATLIGGLALASSARADAVKPALKDGHLIVHDDGSAFSADGIRKAKDEFARLHTRTGREVTVHTMKALPAAEKAKYDKIPGDNKAAKRKFWSDFTRTLAKDEHGKGVYVLICRSPGHVHVLADAEMARKGFDDRKAEILEEQFLTALQESAPTKEKDANRQVEIRDKALFSATEWLEKNLPQESADIKAGTKQQAGTQDSSNEHKGGWNWGSIICIGLSVLLGIWLVTALVRAFTGGGGYGGGYGGGGWGGGFFPSLLGGLFGAAAGMWMYDHFFGGHSSSANAADGGSTGDTGGGVDDAGAGDWNNGAEAGGDYDTGGGGDWGGGGDFGGGGGDFGGGGGDF